METLIDTMGMGLILPLPGGNFSKIAELEWIEEKKVYRANVLSDSLELGVDIIETPARGLELSVRDVSIRENKMIPALMELEKLRQVSFHDYVSYENIGGSAILTYPTSSTAAIAVIRPRLFRKIINN